MLPVVLHDDEAADAEAVSTAKLYRPPLDLKAHGTGVVV